MILSEVLLGHNKKWEGWLIVDKIWKITVDKSDAHLPFPLREKLKSIIKNASNRSVNVERSKGGQLIEKTQKYWMK